MGASRWFFSLSGCILIVGALALATQQLNFGIDFESGTRIKVALVKPTDEEGVREALDAAGIDRRGDPAGLRPRTRRQRLPDPDQDARTRPGRQRQQGARRRITGSPTNGFDSTSVGPTFGEQVANSALKALIFSLLVICAYIAFRFDPKFAVPVVIAIFHDILITAGVYSLTGREVTSGTVAAFLTILGYSLYDTIIVFDRISENMPRMPRAAFSQIVNRSMSEVLTRSLATSFTTLLGVISLLIFGGATLQDFAFAMLVGILSGTYSSIFIASPVLTAWKEREPGFARRRERIAELDGTVPAFADEIELAKLSDDSESEAESRGARPRPSARRAAAERRGDRRARGRRRADAAPAPRPTARRRRPKRPRPSAARRNAERRERRQRAASTGGTADGGDADGPARLLHDGHRPLALHRLPARPLLAGDRRRLHRRRDRRGRLRR